MHECLFSQSGVELLDFCQSDKLKMVSAFSYEQGQTFFFFNAEGSFVFSCEMSLDGPYPFFYWVIDLLGFFMYLGDWPFFSDKNCRFFFPS